VRESDFENVRVYMCGSPTAPGMRIGHSPNSASDGTNQLYFRGLRYVYNWGPLLIENPHTVERLRRISFYQTQLHGPTSTVPADDLVRIIGDISSVQFDGLITNSGPSAANKAIINIMDHPSRPGDSPLRIQINNLDVSNTPGDVIRLGNCKTFNLSGHLGTSITGAVARAYETTGLEHFAAWTVSQDTTPTGKLVIPTSQAAGGKWFHNGVVQTLPA
jgi:hypothetical protein